MVHSLARLLYSHAEGDGGLLDKQETEAASPRAQWRLEGL